MIRLGYYYKMLFFQACARRGDKYPGIESLASSAFWLISILQAINLISLAYGIYYFYAFLGKEGKYFLLFLSIFPFLINYFVFMKNKNYKKTLKQLSNEGIGKPNLKSYWLILSYFTITLLFLALVGKLNQQVN